MEGIVRPETIVDIELQIDGARDNESIVNQMKNQVKRSRGRTTEEVGEDASDRDDAEGKKKGEDNRDGERMT
jgi:hypothetical protein